MATATMTYQPEHLEKWSPRASSFDNWHNYSGEDCSHLWKAPVGRNRDNESEPLTACNWDTVTGEIEKASQHDETGIHRFGHWACGWYELFLIHPEDEAALRVADQWAARLADYPVADEDKLGEYEIEDQHETYANCGIRADWHQKVEDALEDVVPEDGQPADPIWAHRLIQAAEDAVDSVFWEASADHWHDCGDGQWCRIDDVEVPASLLSALLFPVDPDQLVLPIA